MNQGVALSPVVKWVQIGLTVIGLSGVVLPFVPFTDGNMPLDIVMSESVDRVFRLIVVPFVFLSFPISAGYVLYLITGRLPRWASLVGLVLSAWFAIGILAAIVLAHDEKWIQAVLLFGAMFAGAVWLRVRGIPRDSMVRELVLMQSIYIGPMAMFVFAAAGDQRMQTGAWLGVVTLLAYLAQITLAAKRHTFALAIPVLLVCLAAFMLFD